jgi:YggT family protein
MSGSYISNAGSFLIETLFGILILILMLRFILQLVRADFYNPLSQFVIKATQPVLAPLRRLIPGLGGIDMATVVLMLALQWLELVLTQVVIGGLPGAIAFANLPIFAIAELLELAIFVFLISLLVQVVMSWINPGAFGSGVSLLYSINEPLLRPARRVLPPFSGIDFSPLGVFVILNLARMLIVAPLRDVASSI